MLLAVRTVGTLTAAIRPAGDQHVVDFVAVAEVHAPPPLVGAVYAGLGGDAAPVLSPGTP